MCLCATGLRRLSAPPGNRGPEGEWKEPGVPQEQEAAVEWACSLLSREMWV